MATNHPWRRDEALDLIEQGYSTESVAERCGLTVRQVRAMRKTKASLRELVLAAQAERPAKPVAKKPAKKATPKVAAKKKRPRKKSASKARAPRRPKLEVVTDGPAAKAG